MIELIEENLKLKKENKELLDLLQDVTEQTQRSADFWRTSYLTLSRQVYAEEMEKASGDQPKRSCLVSGRSKAGSDA